MVLFDLTIQKHCNKIDKPNKLTNKKTNKL